MKNLNKLLLYTLLLSPFGLALAQDPVDPFEDITRDDWLLEYEHNLIILPTESVNIPLELDKPAITMSHPDHGSFTFTGESMSFATRTTINQIIYDEDAPAFSYRPTLFVTIGGYRGLESGISSTTGNGSGLFDWVRNMDNRFSNAFSRQTSESPVPAKHSQYKYMMIDWYSTYPNRNMVKDVKKTIERFLSPKLHEWDVVLIGHSRGGIFAHELSKSLTDVSKIHQLHTILLDPTAATSMSDRYPLQKPSSKHFGIYGTMYTDNKPFTIVDLATVGNSAINGYDNYGRGRSDQIRSNSTHGSIPIDWMDAPASSGWGLAKNLDDIWARKTPGLYAPDGDGGPEHITVGVNEGIYVDGDVELTDEHVRIWGELQITPLVSSHLDMYAGREGIDLAAGVMVLAVQTRINKDHASVGANAGTASMVASISEQGAIANASVSFINQQGWLGDATAGATINLSEVNVETSASVFGENVVSASIGSGGVSVSAGPIRVKVKRPW